MRDLISESLRGPGENAFGRLRVAVHFLNAIGPSAPDLGFSFCFSKKKKKIRHTEHALAAPPLRMLGDTLGLSVGILVTRVYTHNAILICFSALGPRIMMPDRAGRARATHLSAAIHHPTAGPLVSRQAARGTCALDSHARVPLPHPDGWQGWRATPAHLS